MISIVQPISAGNALRLFVEPPASALAWRILRKGSDSFSDQDDATALIAYEGDEKVIVDAESLPNEVMAFYRPYYFDGTAWTAGATASGTPVADYEEVTTDAHSFLRDRLEAGLKVEVERGTLSNDLGYIQVFTAPPSLERDTRFPLVSVHLESDSSGDRAIGEDISGDEFDPVGFDWFESEGWLADVKISVVGWSLNPDERIELRKAIRRIIIANLPIFADRGINQVSISAQDVDAVDGEYGAPMYMAMCSFSCVAPVRVGRAVNAVTDVTVTATETYSAY